MAAQLPYLPPIDRFQNDTQAIARGTAEDVAAQTSTAAKAGAVVRGGLATIPAAVRAVNDTVAIPQKVAVNTMGHIAGNAVDFGKAVLGLPTLASPANATPPATQAPIAPMQPVKAGALTPMTTTSAALPEAATSAKAAVEGTPALAATTPRLTFGYDPIEVGLRMQERYAAGQRDAVLAAAEQAAATGNPLNATARYMAALHALPTLSGQNNFGANEGSYAAERLGINERERANELNSATEQFKASTLAKATTDAATIRAKAQENSAKVQAAAVRHNVQVVPIGERLEMDPVTKISTPVKVYGIATADDNGKATITDMQGNPLPKQGMPPVPTVGAKVKQADGTYELAGGKKATVKNGVITKLE